MKMLHNIKNEPEMKKKISALKGGHERGDQLEKDRKELGVDASV
jgi:hypothetical protein